MLSQLPNDQVEVPTYHATRSTPKWEMPSGLESNRSSPSLWTIIRSGRHRPRADDRDCFDVMLVRLVTGCSWEDAERLCGNKVSDTTVRERRDEWIDAGVFNAIVVEATEGYDKIIGLDLWDVAVDGSLHKSPTGGEGTGKNPTDRAKLGWKWSCAHRQKRHSHRLGDRRRQSP